MRLLLSLMISVLTAMPVLAHEFWIEPENFQVESGAKVVANLRNGENFRGGPLSWFEPRIARSLALMGDATQALSGRADDLPAINHQPQQDGLLRLVHETTLATVPYKEPEKFQAFVDHKGLDSSALPDPDYPLSEGYRRFAKALIRVGDPKGSDSFSGMETEFVALKNPYRDTLYGGLPVRLYYQGKPRADAQVELYERAPDGAVTRYWLRTDTKGEVHIPVQPGHSYLADAVVLRLPDAALADERNITWETLWAALTFEVPQ